jgi:hypothetical protein
MLYDTTTYYEIQFKFRKIQERFQQTAPDTLEPVTHPEKRFSFTAIDPEAGGKGGTPQAAGGHRRQSWPGCAIGASGSSPCKPGRQSPR